MDENGRHDAKWNKPGTDNFSYLFSKKVETT
jgi:hypothetical protein